MSVLLASSDLAIVSLATGAAGRQQVELQVAMSAAALTAALEAKTFRLVIFDLGLASLDVTQAMQQLRQSPSREAETIAFGPHVQESLLAAARTAGCNRILSRGQFHAQIGEILNTQSKLRTVSEHLNLRVALADGGLSSLAVEVPEFPPWRLMVSGLGFSEREFHGRDLFESLNELRIELEKSGCQLLCAGARVDVFPSGMSRSMGGARKAYVLPFGTPATELLDIFDNAEPALVGTVVQQQEYHSKWVHSLKKRT